MTNREELELLDNKELAKRLVHVRYNGNILEYLCPDGSVYFSSAAIKHTEEWLGKEATDEV